MAGRPTAFAPRRFTDLTKTTLADMAWNLAMRLCMDSRDDASDLLIEELEVIASTDSGAKADLRNLREMVTQARCPHPETRPYAIGMARCQSCKAIVAARD